jgi:hypothetical protein
MRFWNPTVLGLQSAGQAYGYFGYWEHWRYKEGKYPRSAEASTADRK